MQFLSKLFLLFILTISYFSVVKADPVRIISGTASTSGIPNKANGANFDISTGNSTFQASQPFGESTDLFYQSFFPGSSFTPVVNLITARGDLTGFQNSFRGTATINGIFYDRAFFGNFYGDSSLIFTSTLPIQFPTSILPTFSVSIPFTMQGILRGGQCQPFDVCTPLSETALYGSGNATYYFYEGLNGKYEFFKADYVFTTPEPTPEPTTILLLGTGLAGILGFSKSKKKIKD